MYAINKLILYTANLKFLAKTIERAFSSQIQGYLVLNNLRGKMQSAYRQGHSIETALLRVYNDMLLAVDKGKEVVLILLDYSAAFVLIPSTMMCSLLDLLKDMASLDLYFAGFPLTFITYLSMFLLMEHYLSHTHHWRVYLKDQSLGHCPLPCTQHHWRILFMHMALAE